MKAPNQLAFQSLNVGEGVVIGFTWRFVADVGSRNNVELMLEVIKGQQPVVESEDAVRQVDVSFCRFGEPLKLADHVISEITHTA